MNPAGGGWVILLSVAVAFVLSLLHLPETWPQALGWLRPSWVVLVVFFWVMELPHRIGLISAWVVGLLVDVLHADPLGLNGILLAGITYVAWRFYERLRMYSLIQQAGLLLALIAAAGLVRAIVVDVLTDSGVSWGFLLGSLVSAALWPFVYTVLQRLRLQFRVE